MLLIAGSVRIDTAHRDERIATVVEVAAELRRQAGCTHLAISADLEDPDVLHLFQQWESHDALLGNLTAPHVAGIAQQASKLGVREMALLKYDIAAVRPAGSRGASGSGIASIVIAGVLRFDPSQRSHALALAAETMAAARTREGAICYVMSADIEDAGALRVFAEWENERALRAHLLDPSAAAARKRFDGVGVREIDLQRFDVRSAGPIA